jgi:hypothetical protein
LPTLHGSESLTGPRKLDRNGQSSGYADKKTELRASSAGLDPEARLCVVHAASASDSRDAHHFHVPCLLSNQSTEKPRNGLGEMRAGNVRVEGGGIFQPGSIYCRALVACQKNLSDVYGGKGWLFLVLALEHHAETSVPNSRVQDSRTLSVPNYAIGEDLDEGYNSLFVRDCRDRCD